MSSQIFKTPVPIKTFYNFIHDNSLLLNNKYILSKASYKKGLIQNTIQPFLDKIKNNYYPSKQFYITRISNYKHFITVIRQICKYYHIPFVSDIKYSNSKYEIIYTIRTLF